MLDEDDQGATDRHRHHHHHHGHHRHDDHVHHRHPHQHHHHQHHHHHHQPHIEHLHRGEDEMSDHHTTVILSRASSSSSSSSSTSHWSSEAGVDDPFGPEQHASAGRPQHTMSCSNIPGGTGARGGFSSTEDQRWAPAPAHTQLNRRHSRSNEALPRGGKGGRERRPNDLEPGHLYKTTSLAHSLALCGDEGPKRAVSSCLLPTKGILKTREAQPDIRKARSMEVLSPRVPGKAARPGEAAKPQVQTVEAAKKNFVQGKLQFSAFLDEITRQVISPSRLNTLGVNNPKCPPGQSPPTLAPASSITDIAAQVAPKTQTPLPPKKQKRVSLEEKATDARQPPAPGKASSSDARSRKVSHPEMRLHLNVNRAHVDTPPPQQPDQQHGRKDRPSPANEGPVGDRQGRYGPLLTDSTGASPEHQPTQHRHHKHHSRGPSGSPPRQAGRTHSSPPSDPGTESESQSSRSDSSRTSRSRDTVGAGSEQADYHHGTTHRGRRKQHTDSLCDTDQIQALQEDNADLHQNLLQTVVCIENLEAELQTTREELSQIKENYKRLQETHSNTHPTTSLQGDEHTAATGDRKYLMQHISKLTEELEKAHRTIDSLENTNVHSLVEEILEAHLDIAGQSTVSKSKVPAFLPWEQAASEGEEGGGARGYPAIDPRETTKDMAANQAWFRPVVPQTGPPPRQGAGGGHGGRGGHQSR